jgi:branched-chain amino acid transport system ATP-binding protein
MLEVDNLDVFYGGAQILHGLGFTARAGDVVALLGRNGAGKTTTMKSVIGLVRPRRGTVRYDGVDLTGAPSHAICRAGIGYVPEERRIFKALTVEENLQVGERAARDGAPFWTREHLFGCSPISKSAAKTSAARSRAANSRC